MNQPAKPSVLFVCVKNAGKSQMAAALMRHLSNSPVQVYSAGTRPGSALNDLSVTTLAEIGAGVDGEYPKPIDPAVLRSANRVIVIGEEAVVEPIPGMVGTINTWTIDEPSARGIEGIERMRLVRDQLADKVRRLDTELSNQTSS